MKPDGADFALFFDVDGTLIDIADRPEGVHVPAGLQTSLQQLQRSHDGAVALVSGRTINNLDALFRPLRLAASGVHGAEFRPSAAGETVVDGSPPLDPAVARAVQAIADAVPGTIVEDKLYSIALHYRLSPRAGHDLERALERVLSTVGDDGLRILPGHMVFEIKRATFDKGVAIHRFMALAPFAGRTPVFIGDDVTDLPGFRAVLDHGGYAYSVGRLFEGVTSSFPNPASVRQWIANLAQVETSPA